MRSGSCLSTVTHLPGGRSGYDAGAGAGVPGPLWPQPDLGGTGLIIVTGVALETVKQIKTYITRKEYHGYIRK